MTERVDDPTKTPPVLDGNRRRLGCARTNGPLDERIRIVNGHEDAASPSSDRAGAESPHALRRRTEPERVAQLRSTFDAWAEASEPQCWEERADLLQPTLAQWVTGP